MEAQDNSPKAFNTVKTIEEVRKTLQRLFDTPENPKVDPKEANAEETAKVNSLKDEYEREQLKRLKSDNENRRNFSNAIFTVTVMWMFAILWIVFECGKGRMKLSDTVLVALITTATANVFGFFYVVVNYLFNKDKST